MSDKSLLTLFNERYGLNLTQRRGNREMDGTRGGSVTLAPFEVIRENYLNMELKEDERRDDDFNRIYNISREFIILSAIGGEIDEGDEQFRGVELTDEERRLTELPEDKIKKMRLEAQNKIEKEKDRYMSPLIRITRSIRRSRSRFTNMYSRFHH